MTVLLLVDDALCYCIIKILDKIYLNQSLRDSTC